MKNKLLNTLLQLHYTAGINLSYYRKGTDQNAKKIYQETLAERTAYWFAIYRTYGNQKTEKLIADFETTKQK